MNTKDYEEACLHHLTNHQFYQEIPEDRTNQCRRAVDALATELHASGFINDFEKDTLFRGDRTSLFYGLPNIHKVFEIFPALRPICSGSDSPTVRLSEYVDTFLKPIAQRTKSYIRDTTDFINKIRNITVNEGSTLVTMDVSSLYPNIDQQEGSDACEKALNNRLRSTVPSTLIKRIITTILQSNIMQLGSRFFQQIKGTAMGTPMAVNFANIFMDSFETSMLDSYESEHGKRPTVWLRFIDDIFFIWEGDTNSLNHFINYCDRYSQSADMKSSIRFTSCCSQKEVNFLDITVRLKNGCLTTDLYTKPVDTHTYLHAKSFHPPTMISLLPKAQFIRIRRICTDINDYKRHATQFINFFISRGFKKHSVEKIAAETESTDRDTLLQPCRTKSKSIEDSKRVVLAVKWHPRLKFLPKMIHSLYHRFTTDHPTLKVTFPEPPIVAFRKNRTLKDTLVRARVSATTTPSNSVCNEEGPRARFTLSTASTLTNINSGVTVDTLNGSSTISDANVIYAAECTKCQALYVGQTKQQLFLRFTGHRSDITLRPNRCELPQHFHEAPSSCDFDRDLQIHILQKNVTGSRISRETEEDKWIMKLGTLAPSGLNAKLSEYGSLYQTLF